MKPKNKLIQKILKRFGAKSMFDLNRIFSKAEQPLFLKGLSWNYDDKRLLFNRIKSALEKLPDECLEDEDLVWKKETLWLWYHHAISIAVARGDIHAARKFADTAVSLQHRRHENKITRLLWHLVYGRVRQAKRWFREGIVGLDRDTARDVLSWYAEGYFSPKAERSIREQKTLSVQGD